MCIGGHRHAHTGGAKDSSVRHGYRKSFGTYRDSPCLRPIDLTPRYTKVCAIKPLLL